MRAIGQSLTCTRSGGAHGKKASGYHRQARVENALFRYKSIIGAGLRARRGGGRKVEVSLACGAL